MRHHPIDPKLFVSNRERLRALLPAGSVAIVNANDILPTNADGTLGNVPNTDLFYLTGVEQELSLLVLAPDAFDEKQREILFLREPNELMETWEGRKLKKDAATQISGIRQVKWLGEFETTLRNLLCDAEFVYLNTNEHKRADVVVESRDARFIKDLQARFPLHSYRRLAPLLHRTRLIKSKAELELMQRAADITNDGLRRVLRFLKPGVMEYEVEAELIHEFTRQRARWAYQPIIASGANACILHYNENDQPCKKGDLVLLDVGASYANYNADLTRTFPVSGKFSKRQREVYQAVLRVMRASIAGATVGKLHRDWQLESKLMMGEELLSLGLLKKSDLKKQTKDAPASQKYFNHGLGHVIGLDVHDVWQQTERFSEGWVLTVEPGIYLPKEGFGVRLENNVVVTEHGPVDLTAKIPVEADEVEELMAKKQAA